MSTVDLNAVDLNADLGEGFGRWSLGDDSGVMPFITSANVACGFHAGDPQIMSATCALAVQHGVIIGAHVSYPDLAGFGRRFIEIEPGELTAIVLYQIGALEAIATAAGTRVSYVKPHGALYNAIVHHTAQAEAVVEALRLHGGGLPLLGLPGSVAQHLASTSGIRFVAEGFADRAYTDEGHLVPRGDPGALITDPDAMATQARRLVHHGIESLCLHGDTPDAAHLAGALSAALEADGISLEPFVR